MRKVLVTMAMGLIALAGAPRNAAADWVLTPFVGANFSGAADVNVPSGLTFKNNFERKLDYGVSLAAMGGGATGFEFDFGYSPNFFETGPGSTNGFSLTSNSNVTTLTANIIIGGRGKSVRPYVVGGGGLIRTNVQDAATIFQNVSKNDLGIDLGAGLMGFFTQHVGLRGEFRYFRSLQNSNTSTVGLGLSNFHFWRGSLGVSLKF